jgi:dTDP-4-amino-4,6-dideoxygalactose transaminase
MILDLKLLGISRDRIVEALEAEGVSGINRGYVNVHRLPIYQNKMAYGRKGFPWTSDVYKGDVSYQKGICPVAEELHDSSLIGLYTCQHHYTDSEVDLTVRAFRKVWENLDQLKA